MKKLLLGTTALFGAAALATAANADGTSTGPGVTVGGFIDFQAGFTDQDAAFETAGTGFSRDAKFSNDTEVHIKVQGEADNGIKYGAVIELEAGIAADAGEDDGFNADKTYLFLESSAGRVELGGNSSAARTLRVDASTIARATGGIDGDFHEYANVEGQGFFITPDLPTDAGLVNLGDTEDATKITYYTPRVSGFQAGLSYTPDTGNSGGVDGFSGDNDFGDFEDVFAAAINYAGQANDVSYEVALTGEIGESENAALEDLEAWSAGVLVGYQGFSVAGSYGDNNDSGQIDGIAGDDVDYWTLGAAYETGPFGVSVTYLNSDAGATDFENISVGADYQLAPGLVPYVEVSFFDTDDNNGATNDNDGTVVLVGTELSF